MSINNGFDQYEQKRKQMIEELIKHQEEYEKRAEEYEKELEKFRNQQIIKQQRFNELKNVDIVKEYIDSIKISLHDQAVINAITKHIGETGNTKIELTTETTWSACDFKCKWYFKFINPKPRYNLQPSELASKLSWFWSYSENLKNEYYGWKLVVQKPLLTIIKPINVRIVKRSMLSMFFDRFFS